MKFIISLEQEQEYPQPLPLNVECHIGSVQCMPAKEEKIEVFMKYLTLHVFHLHVLKLRAEA